MLGFPLSFNGWTWGVGLALTLFIDPKMQDKDRGFHRASMPDPV